MADFINNEIIDEYNYIDSNANNYGLLIQPKRNLCIYSIKKDYISEQTNVFIQDLDGKILGVAEVYDNPKALIFYTPVKLKKDKIYKIYMNSLGVSEGYYGAALTFPIETQDLIILCGLNNESFDFTTGYNIQQIITYSHSPLSGWYGINKKQTEQIIQSLPPRKDEFIVLENHISQIKNDGVLKWVDGLE